MPSLIPSDEKKEEKRFSLVDFLKNPKSVLLAGVGAFLMLLAYVAMTLDVGGPLHSKNRFVPSAGGDEPARAQATQASLPRRLAARLPIVGRLFSPSAESQAEVRTKEERESRLAKLAAQDPATAGDGAGFEGEPTAGEGGAASAAEEEPKEEGMPADSTGLAGALAAAGAAAGGGGRIGQLQGAGQAGRSGGAGAAGPGDDGRSSRLVGSASPGGAPRGPISPAAARAFSAVRVGGGPGGPGGGGGGRQQALAGNNTGAAGAPRFGASQGGSGPAMAAASPSGLVSGGGGNSVGGAGGGVAALGGSSVSEGAQNAAGSPGELGGGSGDPGSKKQNYGAAVAEYESQPALAKGRGYILCLIKAYGKRYHRGRERINAMTNGAERAALYFETPPPGGFLSKPVAKMFRDFHKELTSQGGIQFTFNTRVNGLSRGEQCFPREEDAGAQAECNGHWEVALTMVDPLARNLDTFRTLVGNEGAEALKTMGQPVMKEDGELCPPNVWSSPVNQCPHGQHCPCEYPEPTRQARAFLEDQITAFQSHLDAAKSEITGLDWGHDQDVLTLGQKHVRPYTMAQMRLNDIQSADLPSKKQPDWEDVARNANLKVEMANTGWTKVEGAGSMQAKLVNFIEAYRETQYCANELARGAAVLDLRPMPPEGRAPSAQFSPAENMGTEYCDLPPCGPCQTRVQRTPTCTGSCPPSDSGKK